MANDKKICADTQDEHINKAYEKARRRSKCAFVTVVSIIILMFLMLFAIGCISMPNSDGTTIIKYNTVLEERLETSFKDIIDNKSYTDIVQHPYTTLEEMGYDVLSIKRGEVNCETVNYIRDDDPGYIYVAISVNNGDNSITTDILGRYAISEKEYSYYNQLYMSNDPKIMLIVPALDSLGRFEEISKIKIMADAKKKLSYKMDESARSYIDEFHNTDLSFFIISASEENDAFSCLLVPNVGYITSPSLSEVNKEANIYQWDCLGGGQNVKFDSYGVMTNPNGDYGSWYVPKSNRKNNYFGAKITACNSYKSRYLLQQHGYYLSEKQE